MQEKFIALKLGKEAPGFKAQSTSGLISLSQFSGRWVVLFSYVKDATSICTLQCVSFAEQQQAFKDLNTQLLGLSVDSLESHRKWLTKLEEEQGTKLEFPLIADEDKKIGQLFGLIDEERGTTVRGVFIIDPKGKIRFMAYYPARVSPSVEETLRVLKEFVKAYTVK